MKNSISELYRERFPEPTQVQKKAIPLILSGKNTLVVAPTGSGKTEAALLPVLEKIHGKGGFAALYITPLRALNRDICKRVEWWAEKAGITHAVRHGDTPQSERGRQSRSPPQLLIITPETLQAILVGKVLRKHLANVKYVIVDELHELVDSKRGAQLSMALERLAMVAEFQRIGISATISDEGEAGRLLCGIGREFSIASAGRKREMDISVIKSYGGEKKSFEKILGMIGEKQRIIFVNTRSTAEAMATCLNLKTKDIDVHHGSLAAGLRINTEKEFKEGNVHTLIATSSLELGMDIGGIDEIIQFGSPRQAARMVQRVGRSGHGVGRIPKGKILAIDNDDWFEARAILEKWKEGYLEPKKAVRGAMGGFEPRESMIRMFREELEKKSITLKCLNCGAARITKTGNVEEKPKCHKCGREALAPVMKNATPEEEKYMAGILRAYGKKGLVALLVYGVGAKTADRVLRKLHREEDAFYLDVNLPALKSGASCFIEDACAFY